MSARRAGNNRHSHPGRGSNAKMHNALRQISARPFQRLTVGASGSDRPVATGETAFRVAARAGGMSRYFPLTGLRSKPPVGSKSALIATVSPVPFVAAGVLGL